YSIRYDGSSASEGNPPPTDTNDCGDSYAVAGNTGTPPLSRIGYKFDGWSLTKNGSPVANFTPTGNTTLYPVWTKLNYTINVNANTEGYEDLDYTLDTAKIGVPISLASVSNAFANLKPDYTLIGYSTDPDATVPMYKNSVTLTEDIVKDLAATGTTAGEYNLYAVYRPKMWITDYDIRSISPDCDFPTDPCGCWDVADMFSLRIRTYWG
ncbi:MAG: InlB B-repeat-containing protein, partial [Oscillospiraceae bacterium]|nr:InlB B-repeat-containing protein [Oscillospiraceae bacterium]